MESPEKIETNQIVICQRVDNKQYYIYRGDGTFENVITQVRGNMKIPMEEVRKIMKGRLILTSMANKNPLVIDLLKFATTNNFMTVETEEYGK